jgi:hypothetical protein
VTGVIRAHVTKAAERCTTKVGSNAFFSKLCLEGCCNGAGAHAMSQTDLQGELTRKGSSGAPGHALSQSARNTANCRAASVVTGWRRSRSSFPARQKCDSRW